MTNKEFKVFFNPLIPFVGVVAALVTQTHDSGIVGGECWPSKKPELFVYFHLSFDEQSYSLSVLVPGYQGYQKRKKDICVF